MYRWIWLLPCLLLSLPALAGERYPYSVESQGGLVERAVPAGFRYEKPVILGPGGAPPTAAEERPR